MHRRVYSESLEAAMDAATQGVVGVYITLLHQNPPGSWHWEIHLFCASDDKEAINQCNACNALPTDCARDDLRHFKKTAPTDINDDTEGLWRECLLQELDQARARFERIQQFRTSIVRKT